MAFEPGNISENLIYPYSHEGKPVAISPSDYGFDVQPVKIQKKGDSGSRRWAKIRAWFRRECVWIKELGRIYQDGFFRSTIPAADVLASPRNEPLRKLLWCAVLAPLIYFTFTDLYDVIDSYMKYPVIYTYEYKTKDTLEFPDVTICNVNPFVRSKACSEDSILFKEKTFGKDAEKLVITPFCTEDRMQKIPGICDRLCNPKQQASQPNKEDTRIRSELAEWIKETIALGQNASHEISLLGHSLRSSIKRCSYASNDDCTHNMNRFREEVSLLYGSCFCFHCMENSHNLSIEAETKQREADKYFEYGTLSSPLSGLVIHLNTEVEEYLPTSNEVGFVAMIHEHKKRFSVCSDAIFVLPGYTTYIGLNLATTNNMEPPYEDGCRKQWPRDLATANLDAHVHVIDPAVNNSAYSREACLEYCEIEFVIFTCKCIKNDPTVQVHPDLVEDYKYCRSKKKKGCADSNTSGKTNLYFQDRCDCRRECDTQKYSTDVSVAGFVSDETIEPSDKTALQDQKSLLYKEMSSARLVIYFHSFTFEHVRAMKKYDEIRVLSNIGGINGMYLGLSFYLLFQALDILIMGAIEFAKRIREKRLAFAKDGTVMASAGVQTSAYGQRRRRRIGPQYAIPELSTKYGSQQRKNIWDVFDKPSSDDNTYNSDRFNSTYGPFSIQYYKNRPVYR